MSFTKLYLTKLTAGYEPPTFRGAWDQTTGAITRQLSPQRAGGGVLSQHQVAESSATLNWDMLCYRGVSQPLAAQTISGTINVVLSIWESFTSDNCVFHVHVYVTQGDSDTPRGTLLSDFVDSSEFAGGRTGKAFTSARTLSSLAISDGDRIVVEIGAQAQNTKTSGAFCNLDVGTQCAQGGVLTPDLTVGSNLGLNNPGYIVFSNAISEPVLESRASQFAAEPVTGGVSPSRASQFVAEPVTGEIAPQRFSQFVVEVISKAEARRGRNVFIVT
jgi:hypothetical protein